MDRRRISAERRFCLATLAKKRRFWQRIFDGFTTAICSVSSSTEFFIVAPPVAGPAKSKRRSLTLSASPWKLLENLAPNAEAAARRRGQRPLTSKNCVDG